MRVDKSKWEKKTFDDACVIIHGKDHKAVNNPKGEYPIYGSGGVMGRANSYLCESGTTIIGRKGTINSPIYVNERFWNIDTAFGLCPKENIDSKYFFYYCKNFDFTKIQSGAAIPSLTRKDILKQYFILPPLSEQRGIAAELDAVQTMIDGYREQLADLDQLAQSIFFDTFGDPISNPKGWETHKLGNLIIIKHGKDHKAVNDDNGKYPIYGSGGKMGMAKEYLCEAGTTIIGRKGTINSPIFVNERFWNIDTAFGLFPKDLSVLSKIFLYYFCLATDFTEIQSGAAIPSLTQKDIGNLPIPLPPLSLQEQFAERVEAIERQKELLRRQLADAETLMSERMQHYFSDTSEHSDINKIK